MQAKFRLIRWALPAGLLLFLAGCALPPVVSVASMALDFASYGETGKTVTDRGLSAVTQRDCSLLRVFSGKICQDVVDENTPEGALVALVPLSDPAAAPTDTDPMQLPAQLAYLDGGLGLAAANGPAANIRAPRRAFAAAPEEAGLPPDDWRLELGSYLSDGARPAGLDGDLRLGGVVYLPDAMASVARPADPRG